MYIRKKYRRLLALGDKQFTIPLSFKRFMEEKQRFHNLLIKGKSGQCWCSYCNHYFVSQSNGNYFNPSRLSRQWKAFISKHKMKPIRLHDLRHTCATYLLSNNVPIATVSKKLGHSNIYTTLDVYTHSVYNDDIAASNLLNSMVIRTKEEVSRKDD